jgi:soluble lytic murein transglycosylase-like protein
MPLELYQLLYPVHYNDVIGKHSRQYEIDPLFVASMIREESRYNAGIVSWAGARGLMQIMPSTGSDLARRLNIRRFSSDMLFDPDVNIQMGTWYMKDLMNRFQNNHALVAGAYNGGPGRMQRWVSSMDTSDLDEFIEDIPITETRRHIKKVLDSYYIYQELYGNSDLLSTEKL